MSDNVAQTITAEEPQTASNDSPETSLTEAQIIAEATNDPRLSKDKFTFGDREFTVVSLGYRQYLQFVSRLKPILDLVAGKVKEGIVESAGGARIDIQGIAMKTLGSLDPGYLMSFCADDLPAMVEIVCNMAAIRGDDVETLVTTKWVEDNASSPFQLIDIVLRQVNKNNMIVEFATFFAQALPIFLGMKKKA